MKITTTEINGILIIEPDIYIDDRGYFFESYHELKFNIPGAGSFVQDNEAKSDKGVLRGIHLQTGTKAQGKLVRVVQGSVFDVAVDLRPDTDSFAKWFGVVLSGENKKQLWIPRGFAHGYLVLEDDTIFCYKCDNYYDKSAEAGIRFDDPAIGIKWPEVNKPYIISEKDLALGSLANVRA